jgi:pimeloyl-ACP methyl ester carboxylesterase
MPYFDNDGIKIHYEIEGEGPDLFMIHGFASSMQINWYGANWVKVLKDKNRLILVDCRGHGESDKPADPLQYGGKMREDIEKLQDHLKIEKANFMGYSMGAGITMNLLLTRPERMNSAILGGTAIPRGDQQILRDRSPIINALRAESADSVQNPIGKRFRLFAQSTGGDLNALAAVMEGGMRETTDMAQTKEKLKKVTIPVLTVVGSDDDLMPGDKTVISTLIPGACHFQIQGKDHLTVVPDPKFHMVVKAFLDFVNSS